MGMETRSYRRKKAMGLKRGIHDLPDEILAGILQGVEKRADASLVCKKWHELDRVVTRELFLGYLESDNIAPNTFLAVNTSRFFNLASVSIVYSVPRVGVEVQVDDECMRCLSVGCVNMTDLYLEACFNVTDVGMASLALCPKLAAIRLNCIPGISEGGLLSLLRGCRSLRALGIHALENVKAGDWIDFMGAHCCIERLEVEHCDGVEEFELARLGQRGWGNLREFMYSRLGPWVWEHQLRGWTFAGPGEINLCPNLQKLTIRDCLSKSKTGLLSILDHCTALRKVRLEDCAGMRDEDIRVLGRKNPQMSSLTLSINGDRPTPNLTNTGLLQVAESFRGLKTLRISFTKGRFPPQISESGIIAIMENCTQLKRLSLWNIPCLRATAMAAISRLPFLTDLSLEACEHLEDAMVFPVGPKFEFYALMSCPLLTDECLNRLRIPVGSSLHISISECPRITEVAALNAAANVHYD